MTSTERNRRSQAEFDARADATWTRFQQTGIGVPAQEVVAKLRAQLEARRRELEGKHRPANQQVQRALAEPPIKASEFE